MTNKQIPVWIDCDTGTDDSVAIMLAHALPEAFGHRSIRCGWQQSIIQYLPKHKACSASAGSRLSGLSRRGASAHARTACGGRIPRGKRSWRRRVTAARHGARVNIRVGRALCNSEAHAGRIASGCDRTADKRSNRIDKVSRTKTAAALHCTDGRCSCWRQCDTRSGIQHLR